MSLHIYEFSDSDDESYDTADGDESHQESESNRRERSRSRLNTSTTPSIRERSRSARQRQHRRRHRHGRRQRQRNQRNDRARYDETWYFPDENQNEATLEDVEPRENVLAQNRDWMQSLESNEHNAGTRRTQISPLVLGNRHHTITWRNNNRTLTVLPDADDIRTIAGNAPGSNQNNAIHNHNLRQVFQLPNSSHPDVNFNLAQSLQNRVRGAGNTSQVTSAVQVTAATPAANYAQLITNPQSYEHVGQQQAVQSLDTWENRTRPRDSWLNTSVSETRRYPANNHSRHVAARRYLEDRVVRSGSLHESTQRPDQVDTAQRATTAVGSENRTASQGRLNHNSREDTSENTPRPATSTSSDATDQLYRPLLTDDSNRNLYSRYSAAFRRQEERNEWRRRRRQRRHRHERREMEERVYQRRRRETVGPSMSSASDRSLSPTQHPVANTAVPLPTPLPAQDWQAPAGQDNELADVISYLILAPAALHDNEIDRRPERNDEDDGDIDDDSSSYSEITSLLLRTYQDPIEGNSSVGEFLRRITTLGRVVISRVRMRITKQYFRRGDFQIALADFRGLHPEHARQVPGVGFTGTVNNMYRLTVKQNSNFGKPTLEIRPLNKRVRKKKLHVCYKIRYFGQRGAQRSGRIRSRIPMVV